MKISSHNNKNTTQECKVCYFYRSWGWKYCDVCKLSTKRPGDDCDKCSMNCCDEKGHNETKE